MFHAKDAVRRKDVNTMDTNAKHWIVSLKSRWTTVLNAMNSLAHVFNPPGTGLKNTPIILSSIICAA